MVILGDFNAEANEKHMKSFCKNYGLKNQFVSNKAKGQISKGVFQENKARQIF